LFIKKNGKLKINNGKIVLIGKSTGTETVLKNTMFSKDFKFISIISMARAIILLDDVTRKSAITTQLFHGIADELPPIILCYSIIAKRQQRVITTIRL
jgi:predicted esterase